MALGGVPEPASQRATATVSGFPSPSRSPEAFLVTTPFAPPHSSGSSTPAGSGAGAAAVLICDCEPGWDAVAALG